MAKAQTLTPDALLVQQPVPQAATPARAARKDAQPVEQMPLQLRLPRDEVRAIKIAAAERETTISDFMLSCFHACMKGGK